MSDEQNRPRITRQDVGSWLSGPSSVLPSTQQWRGERLGLPEDGSGSLAGWGRRLLALMIDWFAAVLLVRLFVPGVAYGTAASGLVTLGFFLAELSLFTWLTAASFGQRICGLAVVRLDGQPVGLVRSILRSAQVCLLIPALIWDRDGRGLHDRSIGTALLRR